MILLQVCSMADYDYAKMTMESVVIAIASTFGNGEAPENGKLFLEMTSAYKKHFEKEKEAGRNTLVYQGSLNNQKPL